MEKTEAVNVKCTRQHGTKRKKRARGSRSKGEPKTRAQKRPNSCANMFQEGWLLQDEYKGWLVQVTGDEFQAKCIACNQKFLCGDNEIKLHLDGADHSENVRMFYASKNIVLGVTSDDEIEVFWNRRDRTQILEDQASSLITKHKWNMSTAKNLFGLLEAVSDDPAMIADVSFERFSRGVIVEEPDSDDVDVEF